MSSSQSGQGNNLRKHAALHCIWLLFSNFQRIEGKTYQEDNESEDTNADHKHDLIVLAAILELPIRHRLQKFKALEANCDSFPELNRR